jgi:hypothetical protein
MRYVVAGYIVVFVVLTLYAVELIWRRRHLTQAVDRAVGCEPVGSGSVASGPVGEVVP